MEDHEKKSPRSQQSSKELLKIEESKERTKNTAIYSLLSEKKRTAGTFRIAPSSALMQVKQFLPVLQEENTRLQSQIQQQPENKHKFDIEHVEETDGPLIEMDLALYEESDSDSDGNSNNGVIESEDAVEDVLDNMGPINEKNIKIPGSIKKCNLVQEVDSTHD